MTASCKEKPEFTLIFFEIVVPICVCWVRLSYRQEQKRTETTFPEEYTCAASSSLLHNAAACLLTVIQSLSLLILEILIRSLLVLGNGGLAARLKLWYIMPLNTPSLCCWFVFVHMLPQSRRRLAGGKAGLHICLAQGAAVRASPSSPA